jgi:gliding motility-associated-like protein
MNLSRIFIFIVLIGFGKSLFSQNNVCANASPFCTGQVMNFPAGVNAGTAQQGPYYGCLGSEPNPAWFFMQIANSGTMSITMSALHDIDFICWGPFSSLSGACNSLTSTNDQACSYSPSATETAVFNAVAGQFYLMLITNFSNQVQSITFSQNNPSSPGMASTNCGFVCVVTPTTGGVICAGQTATISLAASTSTSVNSYTWTGPNSFSSTSAVNTFSNVQSNATYTVSATNSAVINGSPYSGTCEAVVTVSVLQYPTFSITPTTTNICQGGNFFANVTFTPAANPANYTFYWAPHSGAGVWQPSGNNTLISPNLLPPLVTSSTIIYSVTVSPTSTDISCPVTKTLAVTINNPLTPTITAPPPLCNTFNPLQLTATPGGGTWSANPAISPGGIFTPANAAQGTSSVSYAVSVGTCVVANTQTVSVSKFYSPALTSSINPLCVQDPAFNLMNIVQSTLTGSWQGPQVNNNIFTPAGLATGNYSLTYNTASLPNLTICPASTVLVVPVFNPPIPVIGPLPPLCTNAGTVALTATPSNGTWSGNSGISPSGIQTPSLNTIGTNTLVYTAGQGTCLASSSKTFHVSRFNTAALTGTIGNLCFNSNPINLMSIAQNTNGSWTGFGINNNNVFNPSGLSTNTYNLLYQTVSTPNQTLCPDASTITVSVLNPPVPVITQVGPYCTADGPVQLTVTPTAGYWVPSSFLSSNGTFSPALSPVGSNAVQYVIGTSTCYAKQTKMISTEAFVTAAITSSISDQCTTGLPTNLLPITLSNSGNWTGTGIVGSSFNPGISGAGKFTLTYQTASIPSGLCPDKASVTVQVFSLAIPAITETGPYCNKTGPVQLQVSPVGGLFGSGVPGAITPGGIFNPALALIGNNIISYSISSGPCVANAQTNILIEKFISADFANNVATAYCINSLPFNLNSLVQNPGGDWSGPGVIGSMFDPSKANIGENNVILYQTHSSPSTLLCPDTSYIRIKVKNIPSITALSNIYSGCAPLEVILNSPDAGAGIATWNLGDGSGVQPGPTVSHTFTSAGSYSVVLSYADNEALGCSTQVILKTPISVFETPKADFSFSPGEVTIDNPQVTLTNLTTVLKDNLYQWTIQGLNQVYEVSPVINFPAIGNYKVTLMATSLEGCKDEVSKMIEVKNDFSVFIPNSFTPNYDGLNDVFVPVFSPYGLDTRTFSMDIYDRWGQIIYSTVDYTKGWNGTLQNKGDQSLKNDTYVFKIHYKDLDGRVYDQTGHVTLLK